jgi:hypothetical protein
MLPTGCLLLYTYLTVAYKGPYLSIHYTDSEGGTQHQQCLDIQLLYTEQTQRSKIQQAREAKNSTKIPLVTHILNRLILSRAEALASTPANTPSDARCIWYLLYTNLC